MASKTYFLDKKKNAQDRRRFSFIFPHKIVHHFSFIFKKMRKWVWKELGVFHQSGTYEFSFDNPIKPTGKIQEKSHSGLVTLTITHHQNTAKNLFHDQSKT